MTKAISRGLAIATAEADIWKEWTPNTRAKNRGASPPRESSQRAVTRTALPVWPEGAHYLCYIYSHSFDEAFFHELNPNLVITRHAEADNDQPGIPHGVPCLMRNETVDKPVAPGDYEVLQDINQIKISPRITELLAGRDIEYLPPVQQK